MLHSGGSESINWIYIFWGGGGVTAWASKLQSVTTEIARTIPGYGLYKQFAAKNRMKIEPSYNLIGKFDAQFHFQN